MQSYICEHHRQMSQCLEGLIMFTVTSVEGGNALLLVHHDDSSRDTRVDLLWRGETHTHTQCQH